MTGWEPATEAEIAMRDALRAGDQERYFRILSRTELLLPVSADALAGRAPMGWGTWTTGGRTHVLAFTSNEALQACLAEHAGSARKLTYQELAAGWPNLEWWLAVNPGLPIEGYLPAWFVSQLSRGDARLPGRSAAPESAAGVAASIPVSTAAGNQSSAAAPGSPVPMPSRPSEGAEPLPRRPGHAAAAARADALSTPGALPRRSTGTGVTGQSTPSSGAPSSLATAFGARSGGAAPAGAAAPAGYGAAPAGVGAAMGGAAAGKSAAGAPPGADPHGPVPPSAGQVGRSPDPSFVPANEVEEALLTAASEGSTDSFLSTLLLARVLLPVPADAPGGALPGDEKFRWRTEAIDGEPYLVVFTSAERLRERLTDPVETVSVKFIQLIREWPEPGWSFAVNPGTPVGATLPGAQIIALANWAAEVGLGADADADADLPEADETRRSPAAPARPAEDPARPTVMQKVVSPAQVPYYLERGYDRVSGFVHRASEVAHLRTPAKLVTALGLRYPGSPFVEEAPELHVLRWPAYRPSLYRIPYGGQTEAAMRAMEGWVIERTPFRGNGFAPGDSSEVVAEFKLDSARLPHGAQLWRVSADGSETLVAVLDADRPAWRRVGED